MIRTRSVMRTRSVFRRVVTLALLLVISGLLVYGGVHRTQVILAKETGGAGSVQVHTSGGGHGAGAESYTE